jgi:hypothetical protein
MDFEADDHLPVVDTPLDSAFLEDAGGTTGAFMAGFRDADGEAVD